jgi:hypothetical protein
MQSANSSIEKKSWRRLMIAAVAFGLMSVLAFTQTARAQTNPLNFGNNYFVTGDYVVAGVGLSGLPQSGGFATGYIHMPDGNTVPDTGVPAGAQVVAAFLYWQTVESSQNTATTQIGYFGPSNGPSSGLSSGPPGGYQITGYVLGDPNTPVSWGSGGCAGNPQGSKVIHTYRADVRSFLPVDHKGNVLPGTKDNPDRYIVRLPSGGSSGSVPLTLGASLVIIYRVMDPSDPKPLNSIVIYDGTYVPSNSSSDMTQAIEGFYQAAANPMTKLTEIVGNGGPHKYESVSLNGIGLTSLYGDGLLPPFPGYYDQGGYSEKGGGSWDNPTWIFQSGDLNNPVEANSYKADTTVAPSPSSSNGGCVSWGAVIFSTTVQDTDHDGLLDVWEESTPSKPPGYCDASINGGNCDHNDTDPGWVSLPNADPNKKDIYVQMDYMCRDSGATCDPTDTSSFWPRTGVVGDLETVFGNHGIDLHLIPGNAIPEDTCTDGSSLCQYPGQSDVVAWKGGFTYLKNQPANINPATGETYTETECEQNFTDCVRRFQHGKKDSYHYVLFGNALGVPQWSLLGGTLKSADASSTVVTFKTSTAHGLHSYTMGNVDGDGRVTVSGVISIPGLNGTYKIQVIDPTTFEIENPTGKSGELTWLTDPQLSVASGQASTISGASDVGGEDTAITLGSWGDDGEGDNVQAGVFMHELGHTLGLTHGGTYYVTSGSDVPAYGPNCKPNYQSVMNYLFTVDLLGTSQTLDYSEQTLETLDEDAPVTNLPGTVDNTSRWYTQKSSGVGTAASYYCDGTPVPQGDPRLYRIQGPTEPNISPPWESGQDINFDGTDNKSLRGYDDWTNLDLQQMGAAGNLSTAGGPSPAFNFGPSPAFNFGPSPAFNFGPSPAFNFGPGDAEITLAQANSVTRPPRNLTATVIRSKTNTIELDWMAPTFGQIGTYNIYRGVDGAAPALSLLGTTESAPYSDMNNVDCKKTYTYFVTAVLQGTSQESQPSNTVTVINCKVQ